MALITAAAVWLVPVSARAECVTPTAASLMTTPGIEVVFSGEAVNVMRSGELGVRVTFQVTRVWKGSVPERIDVYVWDLSEGRPRFEKGRRYIATAAASSDARVRRDLATSGTEAPVFLATTCSSPEMQPPTLERDLGPGYDPKRIKPSPSFVGNEDDDVERVLGRRAGHRTAGDSKRASSGDDPVCRCSCCPERVANR